ncbi:MAG TPA: S8/S53 family peptidase [Anaerolineales bacterium]|nr:S8/S53 family peptidase [Anaerolineales bacterium]
MSNIYRTTILFVLVMLVASCAAPGTATPTPSVLPEVKIARHPEPVDISDYLELTSIPKFDPNSTDPWQVDLRSRNLTKIDMTASLPDLMYADFDSKTQWPEANKLPDGFDWQKIMENGKDPGLGMRVLHDQGVTGKGIGIAIIDQTLLVDHIEYKDRIRVYEEAEDITGDWQKVQMHGPAVASIAVGRTIGVAPEADLYFIATAICSQGTYESNDFACLAKSIRQIIEINKSLPAERKIRVLSISVGWDPKSKGYAEVMVAVNEAKAAGIFLISTSLSETDGLNFLGLGREPRSDPNEFKSYQPGLGWQKYFYSDGLPVKALLVPMDARTIASPTGPEDYAYNRQGGLSWCVPYLAGMYALAAQVKPDITPKEFWSTALKTGRTIQLQHAGKDYEFGVILDPQALIEAIKNK